MSETHILAAAAPELCLAFVNTRYWRGKAAPAETLHGPDELLAWCRETAGVPPGLVAAVTADWRIHPAKARAAFDHAMALREALNRLCGTRLREAKPLRADLTLLEAALAETPRRTRLRPLAGGYAWLIEGEPSLAMLLARVLWSASDLLAGPIGAQVRRCANPECLFVFLDTSRGGNRRWCSMKSCGNRAKARRHYRRAKSRQA